MTALKTRLAQAIVEIPVFDTHEHFPDETRRLQQPRHFGYYWHYVQEDLIKSGIPREHLLQILSDYEHQPESRQKEFWAHWEFCRNTGYSQSLRLFFQELFGISDICEANIAQMNAAIAEKVQPGWYENVLGRAGIRCCVRTVWSFQPHYCDFRFLFPAFIFDHFALIRSRQDVARIGAATDREIINFSTFLSALEQDFENKLRDGMVAVKIFLAYRRALDLQPTSSLLAEKIFEEILAGKHLDTPLNTAAKVFEDFILFRLAELAEKNAVPVQIHTGMQNGNFQQIDQGNPLHLQPFLLANPRVRFDLFHGGYPFLHEYLVLAKTYPNVSANLAWLYILSPAAAGYLLNQLLETVPVNRIHAFGGDYDFVEGALSHILIARKVIANILEKKILANALSEEAAVNVARQILWNAPADFYRINGVSAS
jgi:hypothetical protein